MYIQFDTFIKRLNHLIGKNKELICYDLIGESIKENSIRHDEFIMLQREYYRKIDSYTRSCASISQQEDLEILEDKFHDTIDTNIRALLNLIKRFIEDDFTFQNFSIMPKVFLSHKSQEKSYVLKIKSRLDKYLIDCWIDKDQIEGGDHLHETLIPAIDASEMVVIFFSEKFVNAHWCIEEMETAYRKGKKIIPVILGDISSIKECKNSTLDSILGKFVYIQIDEFDLDKSADRIASAIQKNEKVKVKPIELLTIDGITVQHLAFDHDNNLPDDLLKNWNLNIQAFIAADKNDPKPISTAYPVALSGFRPQWLITYISMPFFNKRDVFIYNFPSKTFVCAYAMNDKDLGRVLPYEM